MSLTSAAVVAAVAFIVPLTLRLTGLRVPEVVVEILLGTVIGPQLLSWAGVDEPVRVLSVIGLAFLLLLSGLEIQFERIRGQVLRLTSASFLLSGAIAAAVGSLLGAAGVVRSPVLIAIILSATSLGVFLPILKDAGQTDTPFGQVIIAGASIAEVVPIVLLSLLFSEQATGIGARLKLLAAFLAFAAALVATISRLERAPRISQALLALQETTAEIRVRGAFALLMLFTALATAFGLEAILGAFLAGATLTLVDRDQQMTHTLFHTKLRAAGFGIFVPFFFISTGMMLDVRSLADPTSLAKVGIFLAALLLVRATPALLHRPLADRSGQLVGAGHLQATSLSIPVVAGAIGVDLDLIPPANYTALVAAGLLSVIRFSAPGAPPTP